MIADEASDPVSNSIPVVPNESTLFEVLKLDGPLVTGVLFLGVALIDPNVEGEMPVDGGETAILGGLVEALVVVE